MMRAVHKRLTYEDKFSRHFCCHKISWIRQVKRLNNRKLRRTLKIMDKNYVTFSEEIPYINEQRNN